MRRALVLLLAVLATGAAAPTALAASSPGVTAVATISEPGVVSAKPVGSLLYVSGTTGVSIYDVSAPRSPVRIGRLDLPNVQNEDVDVGGGLLLVSDDPVGGRGVLHVVDVRDPRAPRLLSTYSTYAPGLLLRRSRRRQGGIGHTATCLHDCRFVWLAGSPDGVEVVDLRDPSRPRLAARLPVAAAAGEFGTHDVQVDPADGLAWVTGGAGTAGYDVRDPARPRLVARTDRRGARGPWNDFIHHNSLGLPGGVRLVTEEDLQTGCTRAGTVQTWQRRGGVLRPLDRWGVERDVNARLTCSAHYTDHRDGLVAAGFYEQGVRLLDVRDPRRIRQVGFFEPARSMHWGAVFAPTDPAGTTVYAIDHARGIDVLALDRAALRPVRRPAVTRRSGPGQLDVSVGVDDGFDVLRPGQQVTIDLAVGRFAGPPARGVAVELQLPAPFTDVRAPGATVEGGVVRWSLASLRGIARRRVRARIDPAARRGVVTEAIAYARTAGDALPIDDRSVDRTRIGTRARRTPADLRIAAAAPRLVCGLRLAP